jgi:hypothetical protein
MGEDRISQVRFRPPGKAVNVDAPEITEASLQERGAQDQERVLQYAPQVPLFGDDGVDSPFDQPRYGHSREIGGDEGGDPEDQEVAIPDDEELETRIGLANGCFLK